MQCPKCGEEMAQYKEQPCYSKKKRVEYQRTLYRCDKDDTWGRLEVPVGPMQETNKQSTPVASR